MPGGGSRRRSSSSRRRCRRPRRRRRQRARSRSHSARAELTFSVSQVEQLLREGHYAQRLGWSAPLFLAATLEFLTAKVLELAGIEAHNNGSQRITPRLLDMAIHNNPVLSGLFGTTTISQVALARGSR